MCDFKLEGMGEYKSEIVFEEKPIMNQNETDSGIMEDTKINEENINCKSIVKDETLDEIADRYNIQYLIFKHEESDFFRSPREIVDTDSNEHNLESSSDQDVKEICVSKVEGTEEYESKIVSKEKPIIYQNETTDSIITEEIEINEEEFLVKDETIDEIAHENKIQSSIFKPEEDDSDESDVIDRTNPDNVDVCSECTVIVAVNDNPVLKGTAKRASQTIPKGTLALRCSDTHGLGVFTLRHLKEGVQLGPYEGHVTKVESSSGYSWKLSGGKLVDTSDETSSNYLRYINYAKNESEQNLVGFQYNGELYYRICRDIEKGEKLLIYFVDNANETHYQPEEENPDEAFCTCQFCQLGFKSEAHRDRHQIFCKIRTDGNHFGPLCEHFAAATAPKIGDEGSQIESVESTTYESYSFAVDKKCNLIGDARVNQEGKIPIRCTGCSYETYWKSIMSRHNHLQKNVPTYKLKCKDCNYQTSYICKLEKHRLVHFHKKSFKCSECNYKSYVKRNFYRHALIHKKENVLKCANCDYETCAKYRLDQHVLKHNRKNLLKCAHCDYETYCKYSFNRHVLRHDRKKLLKCTHCDYETYAQYILERHVLKHNRKNLLKCEHCDYETYLKFSFNQHVLKHDRKNVLKCQHCDYQTFVKKTLRQHVLKHDIKNLLKCTHCDYETYVKRMLDQHLLKHNRTNLLKCARCDFSTYIVRNFNQHVLDHNRKNPFKCAHCDYSTYIERNFNRHVLKHDRKYFLKCTHCDYETHGKYILHLHVLRHNKKNLLKCSHCDYETYIEIDFNRHVLIHNRKNLFECALCNYSTYIERNFSRHMLKHNRKGFLKCTLCDFETYAKYLLNKHVLRHKRKNLLKCAHCDYSTYIEGHFNRHVLKHD